MSPPVTTVSDTDESNDDAQSSSHTDDNNDDDTQSESSLSTLLPAEPSSPTLPRFVTETLPLQDLELIQLATSSLEPYDEFEDATLDID